MSLEDESTLLIYENKLLYKKEQQNFQRVVNKKFVFDSNLIQRTQELDYKEQGLFKLKGGQLLKVSSDANDIFSIKNGFFYVPKPGTGVKHLINMKDVIKEIDNSLLKKGFYPDKVYLH